MKKNINYKQLSEMWLDLHSHSVKKSTIANYIITSNNHLYPYIGDIKLNKLNNQIIQDLIIYLSVKGRYDKKGGLSHNTIRDIITLFKLTMKYAIKRKYIKDIDLEFIIPKNTKKKMIF